MKDNINNNICIIPARSGSKRIKNKNIKYFQGKPIIAWSIKTALDSNLFKDVVVSTDSTEVAEIARSYGANVPFIRSSELSDDHTSTVAVIQNAIEEYANLYSSPEFVCCLYPTAPLTTSRHLQESFLQLLEIRSRYTYCFSISEFTSEIERALKMGEKKRLTPINFKNQFKRSQDLKRHYFDAGQFYWGHNKAWMSINTIHENAIGYEIPKGQVVDINNDRDWDLAELLFQLLYKI